MSNSTETFDFVIIGSGFGGSVSAMRLAEKGYKVAVLERGKRYNAARFPQNQLGYSQIVVDAGRPLFWHHGHQFFSATL